MTTLTEPEIAELIESVNLRRNQSLGPEAHAELVEDFNRLVDAGYELVSGDIWQKREAPVYHFPQWGTYALVEGLTTDEVAELIASLSRYTHDEGKTLQMEPSTPFACLVEQGKAVFARCMGLDETEDDMAYIARVMLELHRTKWSPTEYNFSIPEDFEGFSEFCLESRRSGDSPKDAAHSWKLVVPAEESTEAEDTASVISPEKGRGTRL